MTAAVRAPRHTRELSASPWEGLTRLGTADLDHAGSLDEGPFVSAPEVDSLLRGARSAFPSLGLSARDVVSSFAGVRPVVGTGKARPSEQSREHVLWDEEGLVTVTGGKLTTFRLIAVETLWLLRSRVPALERVRRDAGVFRPCDVPPPEAAGLDAATARRLVGRHGAAAAEVVAGARPGELEPVPGTPWLWAEVRFAARAERVVRLDDLLLRRVRVGLLLPDGGASLLPRVAAICREELAWEDERWRMEEQDYLARWRATYSAPAASAALCA